MKSKKLETALDPLSQYRQGKNYVSRGKKIASTVLLIISGLMLYADNVLDLFFDLNKPVPNFLVLKNYIYAMEMAIAPVIIIFASRMKPFHLAYLVPLYAYFNMIIGNYILYCGFEIFDIWWYRFSVMIIVLPVYIILINTIHYYDSKERNEAAKDRLIENFKAQLNDDEE